MSTCGFGPCDCPIAGSDEYCAPTCRLGIGEAGEPCKCGHAECGSTIGSASTDAQVPTERPPTQR